jgi:transposase-like protein
MSKIPQGEWNAIATRHTRGETIARIAHDYGCTAPAIHYILKRQRQRAGQGLAGANTAVAPAASAPSAMPLPEARPVTELRPAAEVRPMAEVRADEPRREHAPAFTLARAAGERRPNDPRPEHSGGPQFEPRPLVARGSALEAGFDTALQNQIEESIEAFRANLNAALADRSPMRREELRAAASDLMRMAARTMIVLDRLSAGHERTPGPAPDYPRSAHAR